MKLNEKAAELIWGETRNLGPAARLRGQLVGAELKTSVFNKEVYVVVDYKQSSINRGETYGVSWPQLVCMAEKYPEVKSALVLWSLERNNGTDK